MTWIAAEETTGIESLEVWGLEGDDTFDVRPGDIPVFIDGGDPIGAIGASLALLRARLEDWNAADEVRTTLSALARLVPEVRVIVAHGQMKEDQLEEILESEGLSILSEEPADPSLENVFIDLVGAAETSHE